ncbi:MAG: TatD family hydrolase [Bacteroidetes bacterium]|nr:TatD family hydrolase [Bacteroidota bacterium]
MILADSHTHLYLEEFNNDRNLVIEKAIFEGVKYLFLPNIDSGFIDSMLNVCKEFPENCFPMIGLHPTSVKENYKSELSIMENWLEKEKFSAIGEIGIDLYWDKTFINEQIEAFQFQLYLAKEKKMPVVIHSRNSMNEIFQVLKEPSFSGIKGVFHCYSGNLIQAKKVVEMGYLLGIGGVATYKNSILPDVIREVGINNILLETDAPFLTPVPFRGKRNESSYINIIAEKVAEVLNIEKSEVAEITTNNTLSLFGLKKQ